MTVASPARDVWRASRLSTSDVRFHVVRFVGGSDMAKLSVSVRHYDMLAMSNSCVTKGDRWNTRSSCS
jgi:hypothetical protein